MLIIYPDVLYWKIKHYMGAKLIFTFNSICKLLLSFSDNSLFHIFELVIFSFFNYNRKSYLIAARLLFYRSYVMHSYVCNMLPTKSEQ